jgi:hypothetical protein
VASPGRLVRASGEDGVGGDRGPDRAQTAAGSWSRSRPASPSASVPRSHHIHDVVVSLGRKQITVAPRVPDPARATLDDLAEGGY